MPDSNEHTIGLLLAGCTDTPEGRADPTLVRYLTSIYPSNVGIELLVRDLEVFKNIIDNMDYRLVPFLKGLTKSVDYALASKSSEEGKMIDLINTQKKIDKVSLIPETTDSDGMGNSSKKRE